MGATFSTLAYLVAAVLFIVALRGLSHPETSRQGNLYGMVGMAIAIVATLLRPGIDFGGVGLIACQWAKALGVKLIGTVSSPQKAELAKRHGA